MLVAVWNLLTIVLILVIIWLTRKKKINHARGTVQSRFYDHCCGDPNHSDHCGNAGYQTLAFAASSLIHL